MLHNGAIMIGLVLLLGGCSLKTENSFLQSFNQEKNYHQKLIKTEKIQFYDDNLTKILLTATYMGESKQGEESFVVGIYADDDLLVEPGTKSLQLRLNGHAPIAIKPLSLRDKALKQLSFISEWMLYYQVTFSHSHLKRLDLKVMTPYYGEGSLHFAKIAKYMFNH